MHYEVVDGYPMPARFAGHPGLELCNTWAGWKTRPARSGPVDHRREYLADFDRFAVWTGHVGLLNAEEVGRLRELARHEPAAARRSLGEVRRLRTALYDTLVTGDNAAFEAVTGYADRAAARSRLIRQPGGAATRTIPGSVGLVVGLLRVARAAEPLLTGEISGTVKACPGEGCGWLFVDARGRRRWCSMTSCGNRSKVRAHAARQS